MDNPGRDEILNINVLLVDDDQNIREELSDYLSSRVKRLDIAVHAEDAIQLCRTMMPDVIISDVRMPGMNGLEMVKKIRTQNKKVRMIITTAFDKTEYLMDAIRHGVSEFLVKPYSITLLLEKLAVISFNIENEKKVAVQNAILDDYKNALDATAAVIKTNLQGSIVYANDRFCQLSGYSRQDLMGKNPRILKNPNNPKSFYKELWETILAGKIWQGTIENRNRAGETYFVDLTIVPVLDQDQKILEFMGIQNEITDLIRKDQLIQSLYTDTSTGFPNRQKLYEDINKLDNPVLYIVNIDSFREINDFFGNRIGDFVILEMGIRLKFASREQATVYRMHGDEFAVLMNKPWNEPEIIRNGEFLIQCVTEKSYIENETEISLSVTVGCAYGQTSCPEPVKKWCGDWKILTNQANMALKKARKLKKELLIYNDSMEITKEYEHNLYWTAKIRDAVKEARIVPYYQPIKNHVTGQIEKYECLVRLSERSGTIIPPSSFLGVAKKTRLYEEMTRIVIRKSFDEFKEKPYEFSLNLSVEDIENADTCSFIFDILKKNSGMTGRVVFEILESEGINNYEQIQQFIETVKSMGAKIAVDDYGSGYSNLVHILKLNVDYIKIDGSIIREITESPLSRILVKSVVSAAQEIGIKTIAEYVSDQKIFQAVIDLGVDYSQGYFIGKPEPDISD